MTIYIRRALHAKEVTDSSTCQLGGDLTDLSGQYKAELNTELYDTELTLTPMNTSAQVVESLEYLGLHSCRNTPMQPVFKPFHLRTIQLR